MRAASRRLTVLRYASRRWIRSSADRVGWPVKVADRVRPAFPGRSVGRLGLLPVRRRTLTVVREASVSELMDFVPQIPFERRTGDRLLELDFVPFELMLSSLLLRLVEEFRGRLRVLSNVTSVGCDFSPLLIEEKLS